MRPFPSIQFNSSKTLFPFGFLLVLFCLGVSAPLAHASTYYVDNCVVTGNDSNNGTSSSTPWLTIAKVNSSTFNPGDSVLFRGGCTWREGLVIPSSGNASNSITFGSYGSGQATINGSAVYSSWTTESYTGNTNLCPNPESVGSWNPQGAGMTLASNVASPLAPDGTQTAAGLIPTTANGNHAVAENFAASSSVVYTLSAYVYPASSTWVQLQANDETSGFSFLDWHTAYFNLTNAGAVESDTQHDISASGITYDPVSGWYHIWITWTSVASTGQILPQIYAATSDGGDTLAGNGTSVYTYAWGVKAETGSTVTVITSRTLYYTSYSTAPNIGFENGTLLPADTTSKVDLVGGRFWVDTANDRIYLYNNPSGQTMEFGSSYTPVYINGDNYIALDNLNVTHGNVDGILINDSTNILVNNVSSSYNYVRGVDNSGTADDFSSFITIQNGTFDNNGTAGIEFHGGGGSSYYGQLHDLTISGNTVADNGWQIAYDVFTSGIKLNGEYNDAPSNFSYNATIQDNDVYNNGNTSGADGQLGDAVGIWVDQWGAGAVVRYNRIHANDGQGISFENHSGSVAYGNVLYNNSVLWPTDAQLGVNRSASNMLIYNNTCYGGTICYGVQGTASYTAMVNNTLEDNIAYGYSGQALSAEYGGENANGGSGNVYLDNDFGLASSSFIQWGSSTYYSTYSSWEPAYCGTSDCSHSVESDPLFISTSTDDFSLSSSSPAIDAATNLGTAYEDALDPASTWPSNIILDNENNYGTGWEMGAYVYTQTSTPAIAWVSPSNGSTVSSTVTLSASCTAVSPASISSVQFYLNGSPLGSPVASTSSPNTYSYSWSTISTANGTSTLYALATDDYGNSASSSPISVTVSNPPILSLPTSTLAFSAAHGSTATSSQSIIISNTAGTSTVLDWSASSNESWLTFSPASSSVNGGASTTLAFIANPSGLSIGTYDATATISAAGATNSPQYVPVSFTISTTGIATSLTSPTSGSTISGTVTVTATATSSVGVSSVQFYLDGSLLGTSTSSPYTTSWDTSNASDGSHTLYSLVTDDDANTASSSVISVTVDNVTTPGPVVEVGAGYARPAITGTSSPTSTPMTGSEINASSSIPTSTQSLQQMLASLEQELASLEAEAGMASTPSSAPYTFTRNLSLWSTGLDVQELQQYLVNQNAGPATEKLKDHGTTEVFGYLTLNALVEFQKSAGISPASGFFGPITRAYVNAHP